MKQLRLLIGAGVCLCMGACKAPQRSSAASSRDWTVLFNGTSLKGWHTYGNPTATAAWSVQDGAIHLASADAEGKRAGGDLVTDESFGNFDLQLEWKISKGGNSGIIFYVQDNKQQYNDTYLTGLEMQVLDNIDASDNKKENHLAGCLYDLIGSAKVSKPKPVGEWNRAEIKCINGQLDLYLNGIPTASTMLWNDQWKQRVANSKFNTMPDFGKFSSGHIALQDHGHAVSYRNIRIKQL